MTVYPQTAARTPALSLAAKYALRELRSGLRGFYVFVACIALGVMAISGVGSVAGSLADGLVHQGRTLLGGDASFALIQREATAQERSFLESRGEVSVAAIMRAMARSDGGEFALVDLKAVDTNYPMLVCDIRRRDAGLG
jgi:putative ABC transport system permease protein